jgi:uncharacterized protein (TIGR02145 family)
MKIPVCKIYVAFVLAVLEACSNGSSQAGASEDPNQFTASIEGVVEKGPFVKGTTVTLYELNQETFAQTGKVFTGTVNRDDGSFALEKIELESPYVLVEANGYYWSELSGRKSDNSLKLKAIAHVEESSNININVGTHLTSSRILNLVDSGMDFDKAKVQAESELMKAFFGEESKTELEKASIFDNEKLLALSLIVLMSGSEADVTESLANISENFTDEAVLTKQADNSAMQYASYGKAREFMQEKFPDVQIGLFENQIESFWKRVYGIGECDKSKAGSLDTIRAEKSANRGSVLICRDVGGVYRWFWATDLEISTAGFVGVENGKIVRSVADSTKAYVYDNGGWREATDLDISVSGYEAAETGKIVRSVADSIKAYVYDKDGWRVATISEMQKDLGCIASARGKIITRYGIDYVCDNANWRHTFIRDYSKESYFNKDIEYGAVMDKRDGHIYKTIEVEGKFWMAENLSYCDKKDVSCKQCSDSLSIGCVYQWKTAVGLSDSDSIIANKIHQGICMEGWHVPDTTEWKALLREFSPIQLKSSVGWIDGTNESGFSIAPTGYNETGYNVDYAFLDKHYATFVTSNFFQEYSRYAGTDYPRNPALDSLDSLSGSRKNTYGYAEFFDVDTVGTAGMWRKSLYTMGALRCVKD